MFKRTITFKLTLGFAVIVIISMLTIGILFIQMFRQYTFESHQKTMLTKAHSISETLSQYSQSNSNMRGFGALMHSLDTLADANVWITDNNGIPIETSGMGKGMGMMGQWSLGSEPLPDEARKVIEEVLSGKESVSQSFSSLYNEATVTVGVPILNTESQVLGTVLLHAPVTGITDTLNKGINMLVISLIAALILSVCLGLVYSLHFTRPLKAMNNTALEMTKGNYSARTGIARNDELGQLGKSLDVLAYELGHTIDQLFQEKGKMSDMIASISEGIAAFDLNFMPISMNSSLSDIMHHSLPYSAVAIKMDFSALSLDAEIRRIIETKETIILQKDWSEKKLQFTLSPILSSNHNVTGVVALVSDISESERLEQLRKDFVSNVSHEFRTPLTVIRGFLEAILDGTTSQKDEIEYYHQKMFKEVKGLERLVGDLLDLSRLQSGNISIKKEIIYIPELLIDAVKTVQTIASKKEIRIQSLFPSEVSPVLGDYDRLRQLFIIFLDNAVKYSPDRTLISVNVVLSETLDITIKDQGYGIAKEELSSIWGRFYKSDKSRNSNGTGLGLAIAKQLAAMHDAVISIDSDLGKGTTVKINLPLFIGENAD